MVANCGAIAVAVVAAISITAIYIATPATAAAIRITTTYIATPTTTCTTATVICNFSVQG